MVTLVKLVILVTLVTLVTCEISSDVVAASHVIDTDPHSSQDNVFISLTSSFRDDEEGEFNLFETNSPTWCSIIVTTRPAGDQLHVKPLVPKNLSITGDA